MPRILLLLLSLAAMAFGAAPPPEGGGEALRQAALAGDLARVRELLDAGAAADAPATRHGHTALMFAAERGHTPVALLLLERGADVNARESFFHSTPLLAALEGGHRELARLLLQRGATQASDALMSAAEQDDVELARAALATGRVAPLDLKAAAREAERAGKHAIRELLANAALPPLRRPPFAVGPQRLAAYAGRYRTRDGLEAVVAVDGTALRLSGLGGADLRLEPVEMDRFETSAGDVAVVFEGRSELVEWAVLNRDGDLTELSAVTVDPAPLKVAAAGATAEESAPRGPARPWPQFRGPAASGIADGQGVPLRWDLKTGENVRFRTPIPGLALSSPVIWGDRIFVTTAVGAADDRTFRTGLYGDGTSVDDLSEHSFRLLCLDAASGAIAWEREVQRAVPTVRRHLKSSLANATPATDGTRVVVLLGAVGVLAAYDFAGQRLWQRDVGVLDCNDPQAGTAEWGHASSPIIHGELVLIQGDRRADSFIAAYRLTSGAQAWRAARDETSTWATPNVIASASGAELVTNGRTIRAYEPASGALLWTMGPNSEVVVATPLVSDGMVYITAGYPPVRPIYAIRPGHRGDLTLTGGRRASEAIAWSHTRGGTYIPTPIVYRDHLYLVNNNGILSCHRAGDGERLYQTRLGEGGSSFSASPIAADGRLYFISETGEVYVMRAGPEGELLADFTMDATIMATPAASGGLLVVRTLEEVVGIAPGPG